MNVRHIATLMRFTLRELMLKKTFQVLYFLFLLFCCSIPLWKHFAPETELEFIADFGVGLIGFFLMVVTVIIASDIIPADLRSRRLLFFVMHPMGKADYLLGRAFGMFVFLGLSFIFFMALLKAFFVYHTWSVAFWPAVPLVMKFLILAAFLFCISAAVERFSAIFLGFSFYFLCSSLSTLNFLSAESENRSMVLFMRGVSFLFPHFELFDTGSAIGRWDLHAVLHLAQLGLYGLLFIAVYLWGAYLILKKKTV